MMPDVDLEVLPGQLASEAVVPLGPGGASQAGAGRKKGDLQPKL